jgi:hypothetical protein
MNAYRVSSIFCVNTLFIFTMKPRSFPPHYLEGIHNAGSQVQNTSIGNEPVVPKYAMSAPTIKQENQEDHPGKCFTIDTF